MKTNFINKFIAALILGLIPACMHGLTLQVEAGGLREAVGNATDAADLTVSGSLSLPDFEFLTLEMKDLRTLDLSAARVDAFAGDPTFTGRTSAPANVLPAYALLGLGVETLALPQGLTAIADGALAGLKIKSVEIPATVTSIGSRAMADCAALQSVALPASVKSIGEGAFKGCTSLRSATIAGAPDSIAANTFAGCTALASVNIPASVKSLGANSFNGCSSLYAVAFPAALSSIGEKAFYSSAISSADLSATALTSLAPWAFANCDQLISVSLPARLVSLGTGVFFNDMNLAVAALPEGVTEIPDFALTSTAGSSDFLKNSNVASVGRYALADWTSVQTFTLPASLTSLADGAMANWSALTDINAETLMQVPALGADVWGDLVRGNVKLTVASEDMKEAFLAAPQWQDFNVTAKLSDIETSVDASSNAATAITARFEGLMLHLTAACDIAGVQVYDVDGRSFTLPSYGEGNTFTLDTSSWDARVMIVRILLADGSAAALKLRR